MLHMMQGPQRLGGAGAAHPQRLRPPGHQPGRTPSFRTTKSSAACRLDLIMLACIHLLHMARNEVSPAGLGLRDMDAGRQPSAPPPR